MKLFTEDLNAASGNTTKKPTTKPLLNLYKFNMAAHDVTLVTSKIFFLTLPIDFPI